MIEHSFNRLSQSKQPLGGPERQAYMCLAVAINEAIRAFMALDKVLE